MIITFAIILNGEYSTDIHWLLAGFFTALSLAYMIYAKRIKVFTVECAKLNVEIEGFKMYMKTTEEHRLNILTPPQRTPELFKQLLPYAIALKVSNQWCKKFSDVLNKLNYCPK